MSADSEQTDRKQRAHDDLLGGVFSLAGIVTLGVGTDWNLMALVGVLLLLWGNNLQHSGRKM